MMKDTKQQIAELLQQGATQKTIANVVGLSRNKVKTVVFEIRNTERHEWLEEERIGFLEIEKRHLKASIGTMISWAMKPMGGDVRFECWNRKEATSINKMDRRIMKLLIEDLKKYDLIVTYYGTGFDLKFMRTRAMILELPDFPEFGQLKHFDLYYAVRNKMALHSNRLAVATQTLGIEGKTPLPPSIWGAARLGDKKALEEIKTHNIEDVKILEELYHRVLPYVKVIRKSI